MEKDSNQKGSDFVTLQSAEKPEAPENTITPGEQNPSANRSQSRKSQPRKPQSRKSPANKNLSASSVKREDRYETTGELGQGGWGVVESAIDKQLQRPVAIKRIVQSEHAGRSVKERFLHEAKITSQLQHPGIVPVHELEDGADGSDVYYVMKKLVGKPLRDLIRESHASVDRSRHRSSASFQEAILPLLERFIDICEAIAYAHQQGILHRDLKPDNVMVGEFGETIVVDWGLAKRIHASDQVTFDSTESRSDQQAAQIEQLTSEIEQTISGSVLGTPAYMSPEQARGEIEALGPASDIYSLGVILYEILVGVHPHSGHPTEKVLERVKSGDFEKPVSARKGLPPALAAICEAAMDLEPQNRYSAASELAQDIRHYVSGEPVSVYQEGCFDRIARWCRRHRTFAFTTAGSTFVLLVASIVFGYMISQAHQSELQAHQASLDAHRKTLSQLDQSRRAADTWLIGLSGSLQFYPGLEPIREELIEEAIKHYQALLASNLNAMDKTALSVHPESRRQKLNLETLSALERAKVQIRLGDLCRLQDESAESLKQYSQAERALNSIVMNVAVDQSRLDDLRIQQANCLIGKVLLNRAKLGDCQSHLDWLQNRFRQLDIQKSELHPGEATKPESAKLVCDLVSCFSRMNLALCRQLSTKPSSADFGKASAQWANWLVRFRGSHGDYRLAQTALTEWAEAQKKLGHYSAAAQTWEQLVRQLSSLVELQPKRVDHWQSLANARIEWANALTKSDTTGDRNRVAVNQLAQSIEDLKHAWSLSDGKGFYFGNLAAAKNNLGTILSAPELNRSSEAISHFVESLEYRKNVIRQNPTIGQIRLYCGTVDYLTAIEDLDQATALRFLNEADLSFQIIRDQGQLTSSDQQVWKSILEKRSRLTGR